MDFIEFKKKYTQDRDYPQRTYDLQMYRRVLEGKLYDCLPYPFYEHFNNGKAVTLAQRRPSVRYRLAKIVVDDSVSLLFGEGRFPTIKCEDETTKYWLEKIIAKRHINLLMVEAATKGSVGSVVLIMRIIDGRMFFESCYTDYLTPVLNPENTDKLLKVTEKCKKTGAELIEMGYETLLQNETYWLMRVWNGSQEIYYIPWKTSEDKDFIPQIDEEKTVTHNLGFVPIIWIKNLPGSDSKTEGLCTFAEAIDTNIELDYVMSQNGRGLKYSLEPLLMVRNAGLSATPINVNEGNVIEVEEGGDVKHVEISGDASKAVLEYAKALREICLENMHGNRSTNEKTSNVQSGKAMKMLNQALIWLADKLRISYGEFALINLMRLIILSNQASDLMVGDERIPRGALKKDEDIALDWPPFFESTSDDKQKDATTLKTLKDAALMSQETAVQKVAKEYNVLDTFAEIARIEKDQAKLQEQQAPETKQIINA